MISGRLTVDNNDRHVTHFLIICRGECIVYKDIQRTHYEMQSENLATTSIREIAFEMRDDVKLEYTRCIHCSVRRLDNIKLWQSWNSISAQCTK